VKACMQAFATFEPLRFADSVCCDRLTTQNAPAEK
jgi:hypothetical protein